MLLGGGVSSWLGVDGIALAVASSGETSGAMTVSARRHRLRGLSLPAEAAAAAGTADGAAVADGLISPLLSAPSGGGVSTDAAGAGAALAQLPLSSASARAAWRGGGGKLPTGGDD